MRDARSLRHVRFAWRADVTDDELVTLTQSHGGAAQAGWWDRIRPHSLGWVTARNSDGILIAFVNVAWDGGDHAFLIDTKVRPDQQRRGIGTELVRIAARQAKEAGCEWMEVDFDEHLASFYYDACGFVPTPAGLLHLPEVHFRESLLVVEEIGVSIGETPPPTEDTDDDPQSGSGGVDC